MKKIKYQNISGDQLVDLTYPVSSNSDVWPGDRRPEFEKLSDIEDEGYNLSFFGLSPHTGTHLDAPSHFIEDGKTIDEIPLESLTGRAAVYHYGDKPNGQKITLRDVNRSGLKLSEGDIFILNSGSHRLNMAGRYYEDYPTPTKDLLRWLLYSGIKCFGTDCPSVDPRGSESHDNHKLLLENQVPIVENLADLDELAVICKMNLHTQSITSRSPDISPSTSR